MHQLLRSVLPTGLFRFLSAIFYGRPAAYPGRSFEVSSVRPVAVRSDRRYCVARPFVMVCLLVLSCGLSGRAQYVPTDEGSSVSFKIKNVGLNSEGSFSGLGGTIVFDPANPGKAVFNVTIKATSINTDNNMRDNHLRKESYFDVEHYPTIKFVSGSVRAGKKAGSYEVTGNLTIKETTKEISFPFTAEQKGDGYLFQGEFKINRKDYGVGGTSTLSNELTVRLSVQTKKG